MNKVITGSCSLVPGATSAPGAAQPRPKPSAHFGFIFSFAFPESSWKQLDLVAFPSRMKVCLFLR